MSETIKKYVIQENYTDNTRPTDNVGIFISPKHTIVLFDLDGTLLDTSKGIFNSVRFAEKKLGLPPIEDDKLIEFVGPPPAEMYRKLYGLDEQTSLIATRYHREYGRKKAIYEARKYPGIDTVLKELKNNGYKIGVSTLKKQNIAELVLRENGLYDYFDVVVGMNEEESYTKADTIKLAMKEVSLNNAVMIGDSIYDYNGAIEAGVSFIGALYGFGLKIYGDYPFVTTITTTDILRILGIENNEFIIR